MDNKHAAGLGILLGIAGIIMSLFPPEFMNQLPEYSKTTIQIVGFACLIVSIIGFIKSKWFEGEKSSTPQKRELSPIWKAIHHIAHVISEPPESTYYPKARSIIRQKAKDGEITIWGKKQIDDRIEWIKERKFSEVLTEIPKEYWSTSKILPFAATDNKYVNNPYTAPEAIGAWESEKNSYADLRIDLEPVKAQKYV